MSNPYPNYKRNTITVPAQKRPQNCGTSYCSCIECVMESAQQEPEFFTHNVEQPYDWSEWVCPDPQGYLMKCCDCGLVHEMQFGVAKYKPNSTEDCDMVDDPNLQAVFRMRRSEQWSPEDTAQRAGGLPMAKQPAQQEPVAWMIWTHGPVLVFMNKDEANMEFDRLNHAYPVPTRMLVPLYTSPPAPVQEPLMVDIHPPATQRDRWMYEQGRLAERDPRSHAPQPAQQEPVAWQYRDSNDDGTWGAWTGCDKRLAEDEYRQVRALYTSPPAQRTWVGLTDEEIDTAIGFVGSFGSRQDARAIEAKLKEKNT